MPTKKELYETCKSLGIKGLSNKTKEQLKELLTRYRNVGVNVIASGPRIITTIYHLADIHIRTLDRHQEYREVFDNLAKFLDTEDNLIGSVCVICGDIFHNKDKLVSETILLFDYFIEMLTSRLPVFIIAGNHDAFNHSDRLDTITGIVDIKKCNNLYFLKTSGSYRYYNIDFVVSSIIDGKFIHANEVDTVTGITKISLYHGPVCNSRLDNGVVFSGDSTIKISDFNGYDYVLLGDIHKRQSLANNIMYSGSLIQQNFKEEIDHGLVKWDLKNASAFLVNIPNDYAYITVSDKDLNEINFPKKSRIKIIHDYSDIDKVSQVLKDLKSKTEVISIIKEFSPNFNTVLNESPKENYFETLLNSMGLQPIQKLCIESLHTQCLNDVSKNVLNTEPWEITELQFTNVFMYGENHVNIINFKQYSGVTGILQDNAMGKSSILYIILYALFGNVTKTKNYSNRNIINKNSKFYNVKLTIETTSKIYIIERSGKNKIRKGVKSMDEVLTFKSTLGNLTDANKIKTENKILNTFGVVDRDLFILTNVMSYTNYATMLNMGNTELNHTFNKLLNLEMYSEIYSLAHEKFKKISSDIQVVTSKIDTLHSILKNLPEITDIPRSENEYPEPRVSFIKVPSKLTEDHIKNEIQTLKNEGVCEYIPDVSKKITEISGLIKGPKRAEYIGPMTTLLQTMDSIKILDVIRPCNEEKFIEAQQYISDFSDFDEMVIDDLILSLLKSDYLSVTDRNKIVKILSDIKDTSKMEKYIQSKLITQEYTKYQKIIEDNKRNQEILDGVQAQMNTVYSIHLDDLKKTERYMELSDFLWCITNQKNIASSIESELIASQRKDILSQIQKANSDLERLNKELWLYKTYKSIVSGDKSLPKMIISDVVLGIQIEANKLIYTLSGLIVCINNVDDKWLITIKKNDMILGSEHTSSYEKFVINLGLKLSIHKHMASPGTKIFFIDEVFDCVSRENFDRIDDVFDYLKNYFKDVVIISHNEELKKKVDQRIHIESDKICSKIF
jgi:DNA repair exonuclease SbcCD nuclease subunit